MTVAGVPAGGFNPFAPQGTAPAFPGLAAAAAAPPAPGGAPSMGYPGMGAYSPIPPMGFVGQASDPFAFQAQLAQQQYAQQQMQNQAALQQYQQLLAGVNQSVGGVQGVPVSIPQGYATGNPNVAGLIGAYQQGAQNLVGTEQAGAQGLNQAARQSGRRENRLQNAQDFTQMTQQQQQIASQEAQAKVQFLQQQETSAQQMMMQGVPAQVAQAVVQANIQASPFAFTPQELGFFGTLYPQTLQGQGGVSPLYQQAQGQTGGLDPATTQQVQNFVAKAYQAGKGSYQDVLDFVRGAMMNGLAGVSQGNPGGYIANQAAIDALIQQFYQQTNGQFAPGGKMTPGYQPPGTQGPPSTIPQQGVGLAGGLGPPGFGLPGR